jgi:hypothetical protein
MTMLLSMVTGMFSSMKNWPGEEKLKMRMVWKVGERIFVTGEEVRFWMK